MNESFLDRLGSPDIKIAGLEIWIHGREFPHLDDYWDGNWMIVTVRCSNKENSICITGPFIHLNEIITWLAELVRLSTTLEGEASLDCMEPDLSVTIKAEKPDHITMEVILDPHDSEHEYYFMFPITENDLSLLIFNCRKILQQHPIKGLME